MNTLKRILTAIDFSSPSRAALRQGARLATATGAEWHIIHVVPRHEMLELAPLMADQQATVIRHLHDDARNRLEGELAELGVTHRARVHVTTGNVTHEILAAVQRLEIDLLTAGVTGASESPGIGTIAVRCARKVPTRVLLVPEHAHDRFERIIACADFSRLTHGILEQAFRVARIDHATVTALHVYQTPWERARWGGVPRNAAEMERQMRALLLTRLRENVDRQGVERDGIDVQHDLIESIDYGKGIVRHAQETAADLVVLGTTGRSALAYMLLGTTAEKVLRDVGCAVLTVKLPGMPPNLATELEGAIGVIPTALIILALLAALAPLIHRLSNRFAGIILAMATAGVGVVFATMLPSIVDGEIRAESWPWVSALDVTLAFRLDGLAITFALLICFIGALVLLYSSSYLAGDSRLGRFYATLLGFMTSMLGLVVADNLILIFIFWELTSVTSFLLIGYNSDQPSARRSAVQALLVTGLGGLALLAGLILLGLAAGTFELSRMVGADLENHQHYAVIVALVLVGCFSKSAIVPFHFWLPNAMAAPSPVSALLHSSTMVKAGVYLIARLHPTLGGTLLWDDALIIFGGTTMVVGALLATRQSALKRILAYSTVSSLGVLVMLIGMGAAKAAAAYLLAHAMFKGCLFLVAGTVTQATGEKDPERLRGLLRPMPLVSGAAVLGALSMAGMFPLAGFVGKELVLKAGLAHPEWATVATVATTAAAVLTVMAACLVGILPFFGHQPADLGPIRRPDWRQWLGPVVLAAGGVVAGIVPSLFAKPLVEASVASITGAPYPGVMQLHVAELLWPPTPATALSVLALTMGTILFAGRHAYRRATRSPRPLSALSADRLYDAAINGIGRVAQASTRIIQNGHLHSYVRTTLLGLVAIVSVTIFRASDVEPTVREVSFLDVLIAALIICCTLTTLFLRSALAAIAVLGGVGLLIALVFALYGAPDLAMTQFAVETLIVIIFVLVIYHLPHMQRLTSRPRRALDAMVAGAFGVIMGMLVFAAATYDVTRPVSDIYAVRSVPEGFGRNVVNVILVDFRALDTLGEILVLGIAAIGVYTLLRLRVSPSRGTSP